MSVDDRTAWRAIVDEAAAQPRGDQTWMGYQEALIWIDTREPELANAARWHLRDKPAAGGERSIAAMQIKMRCAELVGEGKARRRSGELGKAVGDGKLKAFGRQLLGTELGPSEAMPASSWTGGGGFFGEYPDSFMDRGSEAKWAFVSFPRNEVYRLWPGRLTPEQMTPEEDRLLLWLKIQASATFGFFETELRETDRSFIDRGDTFSHLRRLSANRLVPKHFRPLNLETWKAAGDGISERVARLVRERLADTLRKMEAKAVAIVNLSQKGAKKDPELTRAFDRETAPLWDELENSFRLASRVYPTPEALPGSLIAAKRPPVSRRDVERWVRESIEVSKSMNCVVAEREAAFPDHAPPGRELVRELYRKLYQTKHKRAPTVGAPLRHQRIS